jgi:hypothetical protein
MRARRSLLVAGSLLVLVFVFAAYYLLRPGGAYPFVVVDYAFLIQGAVVSANGQPITDVQVTLELPQPVFEAVTPVWYARRVTDAAGRFTFSYLACGKPASAYTVTLQKSGYKTLVLHEGFQSRSVRRIVMSALT